MASEATRSLRSNSRCTTKVTCCGSFLSRYRARSILSSRYALLVLLCSLFIWASIGIPSQHHHKTDLVAAVTDIPVYSFTHYYNYLLYLLPNLVWLITAFLSAWLIGWKFKIPDIVFVGLIIAQIGLILIAAVHAAEVANRVYLTQRWTNITLHIGIVVTAIGGGPVITNTFQLGLEQIPEASAAQISSLISWFVFCYALGGWMNSLITGSFQFCMNSEHFHKPLLNLCRVCILTAATAIIAVEKGKFLDNSPTSHNIRTIYQVLKYAYQHKKPQYRSALTYWEDEPPNRLNLGKNKYGGPFKNEKVEDVRTFLQISVLCITVFIYLSTLYLTGYPLDYINPNTAALLNTTEICDNFLQHSFSGNSLMWLMITVVIYELLVVPVVYYRMPNMLNRVGFSAFLAFALISVVTTLNIVNNALSTHFKLVGLKIGVALPVGVLKAIFYIAAMEFICAQSPYEMRNFFICVMISIMWCSPLFSGLVFSIWKWKCNEHYEHYCPTIYSAVAFSLCTIGIIMFIISAKCYRLRTRGHEDEHQQRWVEEKYDNYMSSQQLVRSLSVSSSIQI